MAKPEVAAVVNLHREGESAVPSLVSAWRAVDQAQWAGIEAELMVVIDDPDEATVTVANRWSERWAARIVPIHVQDLGAARNAAVRAAQAEWIAFLDGDDLWGESWLATAFRRATSAPSDDRVEVWHPEVNVMFGAAQSLLHHIESTHSGFSAARLRLFNAWTALSFARRSTYVATPYPRNRLRDGFGYEDWSWNLEVLRRGGTHRVAPGTVHAIRRAPTTPSPDNTNLLAQSRTALRSPYPSTTNDPVALPGETTEVSELTPTDPQLPPQYLQRPVQLSDSIYADLRHLVAIEAAIAMTVAGLGQPTTLPQNDNLHVTASQRALEEIDVLASDAPSSIAELLQRAELIHNLPPDEQHRVVIETIRGGRFSSSAIDDSTLIESAIEAYPQAKGLL